MKSPIKYRGGKTREIDILSPYVPSIYDRYIEPFFGGGALFFYLEPKMAIVNDINRKLMDFYLDVRDNYPRMRLELDQLQNQYEANQKEYVSKKEKSPEERIPNSNEDLYYELRKMFNGLKNSNYCYGTLYYFINKTSYSGMIRYNAQGEYNVPFGRYANFNTKLLTEDHSKLLSRTMLYNHDYSTIFDMAKPDDFMFLDPPYDCIFNDYGNTNTNDGFNTNEHRRLARDFKKLKCKALMVIGKTPLTEELYSGYIKAEYDFKYGVNIRNRFNTESKHIIVTNYD